MLSRRSCVFRVRNVRLRTGIGSHTITVVMLYLLGIGAAEVVKKRTCGKIVYRIDKERVVEELEKL